MTVTAMLDLKQRLSKLSEADRQIAGRKEAARVMREMDRVKKFRLTELAKQLGHG